MATLLLTSLFLPLAGALLPGRDRDVARWRALFIALIVLGMTIVLAAAFPGGTAPFASVNIGWLDWAGVQLDIRFSVALDGLSLWLFVLTALLMVSAVLVGWEAISEQASLYYRLLLMLETGMLGAFVARDFMLFYVFFEFTLIPLFFLIGVWGGRRRREAAVKFFLFTLAGSVLTFVGLLTIVLWAHYHHPGGVPERISFSIAEVTATLRAEPMEAGLQVWIFLALFSGFAVKAPLWPLHTWLPLAHVEAPTAGSVLLAGVLLKIGVYGFFRFSLPMLPLAAAALMPWMLWLALAGVLYGSLVALAQGDVKRLIAYSSVGHMGYCALGLFALNNLGAQGAALQMINHGLATGGLFAVVGMLYERCHTRRIAELGGLAGRFPRLAFFAMLMVLSSIGLPGMGGFAAEFMILLGAFARGWGSPVAPHLWQLRVISVLALGGVVLGAWYMLWMYQRVFFGPTSPAVPDRSADARDLTAREVCCLAPLAIATLWIGIGPQFFLSRMSPTVEQLIAPAVRAVEQQTREMPKQSVKVISSHLAPGEYTGGKTACCNADYPPYIHGGLNKNNPHCP